MTLTTRWSMACGLAIVLASAPAVLSAQSARSSGRGSSPESLGIHGFSVVLVIGGMQGNAASDSVPEAAKKALNDMRAFLPYKRYQLLDAAWMLCCGAYKNSVSGRIRGPDSRDYTYTVDPLGMTDAKLNLRFSMHERREVPVASADAKRLSDTARLEHSRQTYEAIRERDEAELLMRSTKQKHEVGLLSTPEMEAAALRYKRAVQRVEDLEQLSGRRTPVAGAGHAIMDSTFSIARGETVVVGTSRLHGDQALIAILTAAAKPGGSQ